MTRASLQRTLASLATAALLGLPLAFTVVTSLVQAAGSGDPVPTAIIKCDGVVAKGSNTPTCDFVQLLKSVQDIINWMMIVATPVAIGVFAYAGFLFMTADPKNISQAKEMFWKVGLGYTFMLSGWVIVRTILNVFVSDTAYTQLLGN